MAAIHQIIATHGVEAARETASDAITRQCIDAAFGVLTDTSQRIGIVHAGFAMTSLPHKNISATQWVRDAGGVRLVVDSGVDADLTPIGIPYGSIARMILLYLQTEAVRSRSRDIELGRSMNSWLSAMGIDNGGKTYRLVREQARRLSLCRLTFLRETKTATYVTNGSFVRSAILPSLDSDQMPLWQESVRLDEGFFASLIEHPMPVREVAIRELAAKSMAIDVYVWLAYRLHRIEAPMMVPWPSLHRQFGAGYKEIRQFRAKFRDTFALATAVYPEARVELTDAGAILSPSDAPVRPKVRTL